MTASKKSVQTKVTNGTQGHASRPTSGQILIIGYGNELRGDDAVGPMAARAVEAWNLPEVQVLTQHQLTPELAEPISQSRLAIFIDATVEPSAEPVLVRQIAASPSAVLMAHADHPQTLLALAVAVYGHAPPSWWITVPVVSMQFGEPLSAVARKGVAVAVDAVREVVMNFTG